MKDRKFLGKKKISLIKRCGICNKFLNERGTRNKSGICSGCRNDCSNGLFTNLKNTINRRIKKAIKDSVHEKSVQEDKK